MGPAPNLAKSPAPTPPATADMLAHVLDPALPVLIRPDGTVQVGWDPRRAMQIAPPDGLTTTALADVLRTLQTGLTVPAAVDLARRAGAREPEAIAEAITALTERGLVRVTAPHGRTAAVRIHGRGPLSDLLAGALRCSGTRVRHTTVNHATCAAGDDDLVVLSDTLIADPRVLRDLHRARMPHLPVRVRDGTGLVGPLVLPGATSCLRCADLHRSDRDAAWPAVAVQLRDTVGTADRATVLATAALALRQVDRVVRAVRESQDPRLAADPPPTLDTTLEFDVDTGSTRMRRWSRHPRCEC